uniref:Interferon regulatory factor 7 n=1 Tax=Pelodiscus sinensis TaxID=13735 RepID=K7GAI6_PELSI
LCLGRYSGTQQLRFANWLISQIKSRNYEGLCWVNEAQMKFRIPWKHTSRRDITTNDYKIFKAWAIASGKYNEKVKDLAKWKTNFRCALRSTNKFQLVQDNSKVSEDPHKVYQIISPNSHAGAAANAPTAKSNYAGDYPLPHPALPGTFCLLSTGKSFTNFKSSDLPQGCLPLCQAGSQPPSLCWMLPQNSCRQQQLAWTLDGGLDPRSDPYAGVLPLTPWPASQWAAPTVMEQNRFTHPAAPLPEQPIPSPSPAPLQNNTDPFFPHMDVTVYYRGKSLHQVQVATRSCLFTYNNEDPTVVPGCAQVVHFPSPDELPDQKQVRFTRQLLQNIGLLLEQKHKKIYAKRLNKCKVFWALSRQLAILAQNPEFKPLPRDMETEIFDYDVFLQELLDFKKQQRAASPDFTIYLCFGQCFSKSKPKETLLILVKLVPKFCEYFYEAVLKEGASSLNSGNLSLQMSSSFNSLYDLLEQYAMQID